MSKGMKFIYVMDDALKDELLSRGYKLVKVDPTNKIYVFANKSEDTSKFELNGLHVFSNVLTF